MEIVQKITQPLTVETYFDLESKGETHHDFHDGFLYPIEATTKAHNRIIQNIVFHLRQRMKQSGQSSCSHYTENVMTQLQENKSYVYPDIVITCDKDDALDPLVVKKPLIIIEVLSKSAEQYDRTLKFFKYQRIPSLVQAIFIEQRFHAVESFTKEKSGGWHFEGYYDLKDTLSFNVDVGIKLTEIYEDITIDSKFLKILK